MTPPSSTKRHNDPAKRIYKRLGLWPKEIFTSHGRPDLCPYKWSIGLLDSLSALVANFDKFDQAQAHPASAPPPATTRQQAKASADNSQLEDRLARALIEEIDMRIKRQTKTSRKGSALVVHPPKRTCLTPQDIRAVRDTRKANLKGSSLASEEYEDQEKDDREIVVGGREEQEDYGEEEAGYISEDQHAEEEDAYSSNDSDYEGSEDDSNPRQSLGLPENKINSQRDEVNSLPASPSSPAALVGPVPPKTSNHDQNVTSGNITGKASLSAPVNTGSTSAARTNLNLKAVTQATGNDGSGNFNSTSLRSTRQPQPSSSHAFPAAPTPSPMPRQLTSLASLRRQESPGHTHPATYSQSSFVPNKRPRLSGHCSGISQSSDQAGSGDAETDLANNDNGHSNTHVVGMSSERHSVQQNLRPGGRSRLILEYGELSTKEAIRQQSMRFSVSAAELQVTISRQRTLNAEDKETIAKAGERSEKISEMIGGFSRQLADVRSEIKLSSPALESLRHSLDCVTKADTTGRQADGLRQFFNGYRDENNKKSTRLSHIEVELGHLQEYWRCSEQERATAIDRYDQRVKTVLTTVAQHENAVKKKKYWDLVALSVRMGPERLQQVMGSHPVVAEYWRDPQLGLAQDEQEVTL